MSVNRITIEKSDILIVGAGTAGIYFGWLMAKKGFSVIIIDKDQREKVGKRLDIIHFETNLMMESGLPPVIEGTPDFVYSAEVGSVVSPDRKVIIKSGALQTVLRLPIFLKRMFKFLESEGVRFEFNCKFNELIFKNNIIIGLFAEKEDKKIEFHARIVVDASGTAGVIRTSLPHDYGIETFKLGPNDVMFVPLRYLKWIDSEKPRPNLVNIGLYHIAFLNPSYTENEAILGTGHPGSYEKANKVLDDFLKTVNWPQFEVIKTEQGITPWRRPPYSLISDSFLCIGDAAAITRPYSGHGVTATWNLCKIAEKVISQALENNKEGFITKDLLWDINIKYFKGQGAEFAAMLTFLPILLNLTEKEMNFILKKINFLIENMNNLTSDLDIQITSGQMMKLVGNILWGLISRKLSFNHVRKLLQANGLSKKIRKHYEIFPEDPANFDSWVQKAEELWNKKKVVIKKFPSVTIEYH